MACPGTVAAGDGTFAFSPSPARSLDAVRRLAVEITKDQEDQGSTRSSPRDLILLLIVATGQLAGSLAPHGDTAGVSYGLPGFTPDERRAFGAQLSATLLALMRVAVAARVDVPVAWARKHEKNGAKYPADAVRGRSDKYTEYQQAARTATGVGAVDDVSSSSAAAVGDKSAAAEIVPTASPASGNASRPAFCFTRDHPFDDIDALRAEQQRWVDARDWQQYHTPRNVLLALHKEVGELGECVQWRSPADAGPGLPGFTPKQRAAFEDEVADVLGYLVRLAVVCAVDLPAAVAAPPAGASTP